MSSSRIVYQNWIVDLGRDPERLAQAGSFDGLGTEEGDKAIREVVSAAISKLSDNEREFIERYFYMGQSYVEIAHASGRDIHRLEALKKKAFKKLRRALASYVQDKYDIPAQATPTCPICCSPDRKQIDRVILGRDPASTWRPVIRILKAKFSLTISTPQILIGHQKYH